ncbi:MAG: hypothetical protein KDC82_01500 [Bacteroidetes bacterium]|nr:hypothetical protein [Bacteroidota bacterium]
MLNSKLLQIISSLSDKEFKDFEKYLYTCVESNSNVGLLFQLIKNHYPSFDEAKLDKKNIYAQIFGKGAYKDVKVREIMSLLRKQCENFLINIELNHTEYYKQLALLKQFRKRKLPVLFNQQLKTVENQLEEDAYLNAEKHKRLYLLANEKNNFFEQHQIRAHDSSISEKNENFDKYFFSSKLQTICELINREKILSASYNKSLEEEVLSIIDKHKNFYLDIPAVHCYYEIILLLKSSNDEEQFVKSFNTLNKYQKSFKERELKSMFSYLLNYCIDQVNSGFVHFTKRLFDMQKLLLQNRILLEDGVLSHISYRNIVSIAIKLKEYEWAEKFIEDYKTYVSELHQENAYSLSKSNLLYAQENFSETVLLLNQIEFTDVYYACTAKFTLLKAYFALKEWETLDYFVSSFQLYLKRNKDIALNFKKSSENFLKHFKKLLLVHKQLDFKEEKKMEKKLQDLKKNIEEEGIIANKTWLLEELDKIKL